MRLICYFFKLLSWLESTLLECSWFCSDLCHLLFTCFPSLIYRDFSYLLTFMTFSLSCYPTLLFPSPLSSFIFCLHKRVFSMFSKTYCFNCTLLIRLFPWRCSEDFTWRAFGDGLGLRQRCSCVCSSFVNPDLCFNSVRDVLALQSVF